MKDKIIIITLLCLAFSTGWLFKAITDTYDTSFNERLQKLEQDYSELYERTHILKSTMEIWSKTVRRDVGMDEAFLVLCRHLNLALEDMNKITDKFPENEYLIYEEWEPRD